jgi:hypothetical protein
MTVTRRAALCFLRKKREACLDGMTAPELLLARSFSSTCLTLPRLALGACPLDVEPDAGAESCGRSAPEEPAVRQSPVCGDGKEEEEEEEEEELAAVAAAGAGAEAEAAGEGPRRRASCAGTLSFARPEKRNPGECWVLFWSPDPFPEVGVDGVEVSPKKFLGMGRPLIREASLLPSTEPRLPT